MKFLASLERSGELIAVKCLQRREKASVSSILSLSLCLSASIDSFHSLLRSLFPCSPRCCTFLRNQIKHCLPSSLARLTCIADDRDLAHLQLLCFVSIPSSPISPAIRGLIDRFKERPQLQVCLPIHCLRDGDGERIMSSLDQIRVASPHADNTVYFSEDSKAHSF